jgi:hypothetical protein
MSESSKGNETGKEYPQGKRNGEANGGHADPPDTEAGAVDVPDQPAAEESLLDDSNLGEADLPRGPDMRLGAWGLKNGSELTRLLNDAALMDTVVSAMVENSKTVDKLAQEFSAKLREALANDDELRRWLIDVLMLSDKFRGRVARAMAKSIR